MKATVELVYDDKKRNRELTVDVKGSPKNVTFMNSVDKAVEKAAGEDKDWTRWWLRSVKD